jgi:acetoin utilization protein AcuB
LDDTLETIRRIFDNFKFHHLLVLEKGKLVGVISDRDLLKWLCPGLDKLSEKPHGRMTLGMKAHQIMSHDPITIFKYGSIEKAAKLMLDHSISCLPVISTAGGIEGIVTWKDILGFYLKY